MRISSGAIDIDLDVSAKVGLTSYTIEQMLRKVAGLSTDAPLTTQHVALFTTAPDIKSGAGGTEVTTSGTAYARPALTPSSGWTAAANGAIENAAQIDWALATAAWGTVNASAVVDTASGAPTKWLAVDPIPGVIMDSGDDFFIAAGAFDIASVGTFNINVLRPLWQARVPIANFADIHDFLKTGMVRIYESSALYLLVQPDSTATGLPYLNIEVAVG